MDDDFRTASLQAWSSVAPDWAQLIERIDRQLGQGAEWMMDAIALSPGERVLELAGGPGTVSMMAATAVGPEGRVTYSDFSEEMVQVASARLAAEGMGGVECRVIDALQIDEQDGSFDAVVCRMGYMLMEDPARALIETARVLVPGGRVALTVWSDPDSNPWASLPIQAVAAQLEAPPPPGYGPGLWGLADEDRLRQVLDGAGLETIVIERLDTTVEFDSVEQWIEITRRLAGPLRSLMDNLDEDARTGIETRMREAAQPYEQQDGRLSMPQRMVAASAHKQRSP